MSSRTRKFTQSYPEQLPLIPEDDLQQQAAINSLNESRNILIWKYTFRHFLHRSWQNIQHFIIIPFCCLLLIAYCLHTEFYFWIHTQFRNLVNFNFPILNQHYANLEIEGNIYSNYNEIMETVGIILQENNFHNDLTILKQLKSAIVSLPWIQDVEIYQTLSPNGNDIHITIHEEVPEFLWINNKGTFVVLKSGKTISDFNSEDFQGMVQIVADNLSKKLFELWELVSLNETLFPLLEQITSINQIRFNLLLRNGTVVKLPIENYYEAIGFLVKCLQQPGLFYRLKCIDLRLPDRVFLEYDRQTINLIRQNYI